MSLTSINNMFTFLSLKLLPDNFFAMFKLFKTSIEFCFFRYPILVLCLK
jgi:hypothetical protein